jgi:hypothetical protein
MLEWTLSVCTVVGTYSSEQLMVVCVSQSTLLRSCDWCSKRREEDDILWVLLEYVLEALLDETRHCEGCDTCVMLYRQSNLVKTAARIKESSGENVN